MIGEAQLTEVRKLFSADSPVINWAREEIEAQLSELLDISNIDTSETIAMQEIALEAKARKLAAERLRELFIRLGFPMENSTKQANTTSFR